MQTTHPSPANVHSNYYVSIQELHDFIWHEKQINFKACRRKFNISSLLINRVYIYVMLRDKQIREVDLIEHMAESKHKSVTRSVCGDTILILKYYRITIGKPCTILLVCACACVLPHARTHAHTHTHTHTHTGCVRTTVSRMHNVKSAL